MLKILWVCNLVLPRFCDVYQIKKSMFGGWMTGMLGELEKYSDIEIAFCFPIYDDKRFSSGEYSGHKYYSFHGKYNDQPYNSVLEKDFVSIYTDYTPDIIHIWGTEYNHARAAFEAAIQMNLRNKVLVDIQGIIALCSKYYALGIPESYCEVRDSSGNSINDIRTKWEEQGVHEKYIIRNARYVSGRTDFDKFYAYSLNKDINYMYCQRILRKNFYLSDISWDINRCKRHSIFVSQAGYPLKGIHHLIKAVSILKEEFNDISVKVAGKSPLDPMDDGLMTSYGNYIDELIKRYDLKSNFDFIGMCECDEMIGQYINAHVVVSPSNIENPSNSIMEAMYIGAPIVASYVGGSPDLIQNGADGYLFQADNAFMLAGYIRMIFVNDAIATKISGNAKYKAQARNDPSEIGKQQYENYMNMMHEKKG